MQQNEGPRTQSRWLSMALGCLALSGCAGPNQVARDAHHIGFADLNGPERKSAAEKLMQVPTVVHFKRGERIPFDMGIDSSLAEIEVPMLELVVKRDFYVLFRSDGPPLISEDGVDFEAEHENYFMFGFKVEKDRPALMRLRLGIRADGSVQATRESAAGAAR